MFLPWINKTTRSAQPWKIYRGERKEQRKRHRLLVRKEVLFYKMSETSDIRKFQTRNLVLEQSVAQFDFHPPKHSNHTSLAASSVLFQAEGSLLQALLTDSFYKNQAFLLPFSKLLLPFTSPLFFWLMTSTVPTVEGTSMSQFILFQNGVLHCFY